jgi:hypothetical protein
LPGYRTDVTGLTRDETRALGFLLHSVLTTGGAQEDLGLGAPEVRADLAVAAAEVAALYSNVRLGSG